jgi:excisionase family DNA binding protein
MPETMTVSEAAKELGVTINRIQQLIASGQLVTWREGRKRVIDAQSVTERKQHLNALYGPQQRHLFQSLGKQRPT